MNRPWNDGNSLKEFTLSFWCDTPVETDTCTTGYDFETEREARLALVDLKPFLSQKDMSKHYIDDLINNHPYILLDGPSVHEVIVRQLILERVNKQKDLYDDEAKRERAMESGMGLGVQAYNEMMGYEVEEYDPDMEDNDR